ncbi:MAG: hypothetical protein NTX79_06550 [Candidatus Micrarchaeota archaeon]|nr:hypothetical protein [Candidatus Micrarchaeota archaeon]
MSAAFVSTELLKSVEEVFVDNSDFISTGYIDPKKVKKFENVLDILDKRKSEWALSERLSPIDSLRIYGAYSTLYNVFYGISDHLDLGIKRKENPKAAKEVYPLIQDSLRLVALVENVNTLIKNSKGQPSTDAIDDVFHLSRKLYSDAVFRRVILSGEIRNKDRLVERLGKELFDSQE